MPERLKQVQERLLTFWNKYTSKQKTVIVCVLAGILFTLVVLTYFINRPTYVQLARLSDSKTASEMKEALDAEGIQYKMSTKNGETVFNVNKDSFSDATLIIGSSDILSEGMTWEDALDNDMSTTTAEKNLKSELALSSSLRLGLRQFKGVQDAIVNIDRPEEDYTIFSEQKETSVAVVLDLSDTANITANMAQAMAYYLTNAVGNTNTDSIGITDRNGNLLFVGGTDNALGGNVNDASEFKVKLQNQISDNVNALLMKYGYEDVQIGNANIVFNMDKITELATEYSVAEGQEQGYYSTTYNYKSNGSSGSGGVPGTDSNSEETDYMAEDSTSSDTETTVDKANYLPNEVVKNIEYEVGAVKPIESSMAIVVTDYKIVKEDILKAQGALKGTTFEEYIAANDVSTPLEISEDVTALVSDTTGIAANSLTIVGWTKPIFQASEKTDSNSASNYIMIALAVLIIALLAFVIFKGMAPMEITEMEPELSVEELLATTKENQSLDDIEFTDKSETRKMIEKFVDENPEAVANLLRNWLNDDWG